LALSDRRAVLYKYVSGRRALSCIPEGGDGTLRATQPIALNDSFECAISPSWTSGDEREDDRRLADALTQINARNPVSAEEVGRARRAHGSLFASRLFARQVSTLVGIVSFATDPRHPLLWAHYADNGSGLAIGYDAEELRKVAGCEELLRPVHYRDRPPVIADPADLVSPGSNLPALLSQKSSYWQYEEEWRLIVAFDRSIGTGNRDQNGQPISLVRIPNSAVASVHYTDRTSRETVDAIRGRLADSNNRYGPDGPLKLVLSAAEYSYEQSERP